MNKKNKEFRRETTEEAIARGVTVQRFAEGKISKRELKKRNKAVDEGSEQVDIKLLWSRCSPEQREKLKDVLKAQGQDIEDFNYSEDE